MKGTDQHEARAFFTGKVLAQAQKEGVSLSEAERYMLSWSETDPAFHQDTALNQQFEKETTANNFEEKITALLLAAFNHDISRDKESKQKYKEAYQALKKGDHYLLVMIEKSLGSKLKKWWFF